MRHHPGTPGDIISESAGDFVGICMCPNVIPVQANHRLYTDYPERILATVDTCLPIEKIMPFDGLVSLYVVSALFGLFQGGIVPAYAVIIREFFPPEEAGMRVGTVLMATVFGMALGGWMSGVIFDLTGSDQAAFVNGILWNLLNLGIAVGLLRRPGRPVEHAQT